VRRVLLVLSVIALAVIALPSAAGAQGADVYGVGGGSINLPSGQKDIKFAFSAHAGPQGDFGSFRFTIEDPNFPLDAHVDIDCVNVAPFLPGAGGWVGGPVTKVTPDPNIYGISEGTELVFGINDFGNPSDLIRDELSGYFGSPQVCSFLAPFPQVPISQGNINIKVG
jgi:hypothetical protein